MCKCEDVKMWKCENVEMQMKVEYSLTTHDSRLTTHDSRLTKNKHHDTLRINR